MSTNRRGHEPGIDRALLLLCAYAAAWLFSQLIGELLSLRITWLLLAASAVLTVGATWCVSGPTYSRAE